MRVLDAIIKALKALGGEATLHELYIEVNKIRPTPEHSIRARLYEHSSDCDIYKNSSEDLFESSEGKGKGKWKFRIKGPSELNSWKDEIFHEENFYIGEAFKTKEEIRLKSNLTPMKGSRESWAGYGTLANAILLFVNLDKQDADEKSKFNDYFDGVDFFWESQNENTIETPYLKKILEGIDVFLFCRINKKDDWLFVGKLNALDFDETTKPIQMQFEILDFQESPNESLKNIYNWKPNITTIVPKISSEPKTNRRKSQGYLTDTKKKNAIELFAMEKAYEFYSKQGYEVIDCSDSRGLGYDYKCTKNENILEVEVKGTQSLGNEINLTKNEIDNARTTNNNAVLFIVHSMELVLKNNEYQILRSEQTVINNWIPKEEDLEALTFKYKINY